MCNYFRKILFSPPYFLIFTTPRPYGITRTDVTFRVTCAGLHSNWAHVNSKFSDACLAYPITCLGHPGRVIVRTWHSDAVSVPGHHAAAVNSGSYLKTPFTYRHEPFMHV